MSVAELLDSLLPGPALIYGSLPPHARDLDLLVRGAEARALRAELPRAGFETKGAEWVRFADCSVDVVELTEAAAWHLPAVELASLFDDSVALEGMRELRRPSPRHALLILARRVACGDGELGEKLRARVANALGECPHAWSEARERAGAWSAHEALRGLEQAYRTGARVPARQRAAARRERPVAGAGKVLSPMHLRDLAWRARRAQRRRVGTVVALSGLDGAGKSSQALALCETLERLGREATVVRTRIRWDDSLWSISEPIKRVIAPLAHLIAARIPADPLVTPGGPAGSGDGAPADSTGDGEAPTASDARHPVTRIRERSALLTDLWTMAITLANASLQWRLMRGALLRRAVVVCDRYTLDSIVELRYSYGSERSLRTARASLRLLYPRPLRAYLLDVSPQAALERKGEWGLQWLADHRALYLQESERSGVRVLDAERAPSELCTEIARELWLAGI